jgi:hypothetical protein
LSSTKSLISGFVDDVLRLIREAKVEDLLDLVAAEPRPIPPLEDSEPLLQDPIDDDLVDAVEPDEEGPVTRVSPVRRVAPARRMAPVRRIAPVVRIGRRSPHPATVEEITDPASLLAIAPESGPSLAAPPAPPTLPTLLTDPTDDAETPPPSSSTESRVLVRLNSNETVARASNAGIVIRRRKIQ